MLRVARIAVIGGGIAGLSTAWALTKRGADVTIYEQGPIPNPMSASGDEHRIIRRAYGTQGGYQSRIDEAYEAWEEMFADLGERHLVDTGFLLVSQRDGDEADQYYRGLLKGGYPHEKLAPDTAAQKFPFLEPGTFQYAVTSPEGGALLCQKIARDLGCWLAHNGADVRENTKVRSVDPQTGAVNAERFDAIVIAAGAWVLELFPQLADRLTTYRTAVAYFTPPENLADAWNKAPVILDVGADTDGYIIPPINGSGVKFGTGLHKRKSSPDMNREPLPGEAEQIIGHFSPPFLRLGEYTHEKTVTCAYTFTGDEHFLVEQMGKTIVLSACSGHGYKFGAAIGRRVAEAVQQEGFSDLKRWIEARD